MGRLRKLIPRYSLRTLVLFTLLVTSGVGLWWHWEPWVQTLAFEADFKDNALIARFSADGKNIEIFTVKYDWLGDPSGIGVTFPRERYVYDSGTGEQLNAVQAKVPGIQLEKDGSLNRSQLSKMINEDLLISKDGSRRLDWGSPGGHGWTFFNVRVRDNRTSQELAWVDNRSRAGDHEHMGCALSGDGNSIVAVGPDPHVRIYRRRRPEWWWGVFWLWEFWLTVVFAGLFVWSVVRDRRALRARASE